MHTNPENTVQMMDAVQAKKVLAVTSYDDTTIARYSYRSINIVVHCTKRIDTMKQRCQNVLI